jgi:hypothetical protein
MRFGEFLGIRDDFVFVLTLQSALFTLDTYFQRVLNDVPSSLDFGWGNWVPLQLHLIQMFRGFSVGHCRLMFGRGTQTLVLVLYYFLSSRQDWLRMFTLEYWR